MAKPRPAWEADDAEGSRGKAIIGAVGWLETEWLDGRAREAGRPVRGKAVFRLGVSRRAGRTGVRAFVGARKRGNARGAKGRREVET